MNMKPLRPLLIFVLTAGWLSLPLPPALAAPAPDQIEVARTVLKADRQAIVAQNLQLTDAEAQAFWPLYHQYRAELEQVGDGLLKLVREYARLYPNVPEAQAKQLLKDLGNLEKKHANTRATYLKKFGKILPATKTLRFAQVESRLDLALRLELAASIPLVTIGQ